MTDPGPLSPLSPRASRAPREYARRSQSDRLLAAEGARVALAADADIRAAMEPDGCDAAGIAEGQAIYEAVRAAGKTQTSSRTGRLDQTATQDSAAAEALYRPLAARAHVLFKERRDDLVALGLTGEHGHSIAERVDRMRDFAQTAREPERIEAFEKVRITAKAFADLDAALDDAATHATAQDRRAGTSQDASATKTQAFAALEYWMSTMHGHARISLADCPQLLEPLGIRPR